MKYWIAGFRERQIMSRQIALALIRDLFFRSKIDAVAAAVGAEVGYASTLDAVASRCAELKPSVIFTDLSDDAFPAVESLKQILAAAPTARVIGFASHVDLKPLKAAREAGYELTLSRSEFTARLPDLLRP
jgi:DNA-binding NarL/FixJ family response regulator